MGSAGKYAAIGTGAGALFGPVGMVAGGAIGGAIGLRKDAAEAQLAGARQMQTLNMMMSAADMILQQQRQDAARRAMQAAFREIDESFGVGDSDRARRNKEIIQRMASDVGEDVAAPMQDQTVANARERSLQGRRSSAARGVGGSVDESMKRSEKEAFASDVVATGMSRDTAEQGYLQDVEQQRLSKRDAVRSEFDPEYIGMPFGSVQRASGMSTAAKSERLAGIRPLVGEGIGLGIDVAKMAAGAAMGGA